MELYTEKLSDKTIYYPYNETCDVYGPPRAGKRAQQYCDEKNQYKGGHYVLHTKKQYDEWYEKKGQHLEALGINSGWDY